MTFTVSEDLKRKAQARRDVNWSAVVAQAIEQRLQAFAVMESIASRSKMTQKDVDEIAARIDRSMARRLGLLP